MHDNDDDHPLRVGSLFTGYGGLDVAVEHAFDAETIWFSENNPHVARVFAHHWPGIPNLGDITTIDWRNVDPVDVLCGGFPCQDVSVVGKRAGLAPGTRSGLWSHMAAAIDVMRPRYVVIENVRGLLSASAVRQPWEGDDDERRNPDNATPDSATLRDLELDPWHLGDESARPLRAAGAVLGDLADLRYDARWIGLPASRVGAPHPRFRVFILAHRALSDAGSVRRQARRGDGRSGPRSTGHDHVEPPAHRLRASRTGWLDRQEHRVGDVVVPDRQHLRRWGRYADAIARWEHIIERSAPTPAVLDDFKGPRASPEFVEWLMGLPYGWVTEPTHGLTPNQQTTALGNGVQPLQATAALSLLADVGDSLRGSVML